MARKILPTRHPIGLPAQGGGVAIAPEAPHADEVPKTPEPAASTPSPPAPDNIRCRVRWHFTGFRDVELQAGDEVVTTETEAAPFLGGVLTRIPVQEP